MDILDNLDNMLFVLDYFAGCLEKRQTGSRGHPLELINWDGHTCSRMAERIRQSLSSEKIWSMPKPAGKRTRIKSLAADLAIESMVVQQLKSSLCNLAQEWIDRPGEPDWDAVTCRQAATVLFKLVSIKPEALYDHDGHADWDLINPDDALRRKALVALVDKTLKKVYRKRGGRISAN